MLTDEQSEMIADMLNEINDIIIDKYNFVAAGYDWTDEDEIKLILIRR